MKLSWLLLFLLSGGMAATAAPTGEPGLAQHFYAGRDFLYHIDSRIVTDTRVDLAPRRNIPWPDAIPKWSRNGNNWSAYWRGTIQIPADGVYRFRSRNRELLRLGTEYLDLQRSNEIELKRGDVPFQRYLAARSPLEFNVKSELEWQIPGGGDFVPIPGAAFRHSAADKTDHAAIRSDLPMTERPGHAQHLHYTVHVPDDGFYRLSVRRAGNFIWGNITPGATVGVWLDGEHRRHFYNIVRDGGYLDDETVTFYLKRGAHHLEFRGTGAGLYRVKAPRIWWTKLTNPADTLVVTEATPGENVFRRGEPVRWTVRRSTRGATAPVELQFNVFRQRTAEVVWSSKIQFPPNRAAAVAELDFPKNLDGAFEYTITGPAGKILDGPWQFLVIDTTPPRVKPAKKINCDIASFGVKVDQIDCGGATHHFRDNQTSKVVRNAGLAYRVSGPKSDWVSYYNIGKKQPGDPIKVVGHLESNKKYPGQRHGMTDTDWFGYTLQVKNPHRAHLAVIHIPTDQYRRMPIQLIDPVTGQFNGAFYEIHPTPKPELVKMYIPFWPNHRTIDVLTYPSTEQHGMLSTPSAVAKIELYECPDGFPALPPAQCGWNPDRKFGWSGEQADLSPERAATPPLWNDDYKVPHNAQPSESKFYYDFHAYATAWQRFGEYSAWRGDNFFQWPVHTYDMAHVQTERLPWGNGLFVDHRARNFRPIDKYRRNTLKIITLLCEKYGIDFYGDIQININVPQQKNSVWFRDMVQQTENAKPEAMDGAFLDDGQTLGGNLNPSHPVARSFLINFYGDIARFTASTPAFKGMNIRQWPKFSCTVAAWFNQAEAGYDDFTIGRFEQDTGLKVPRGDKPDDRKAVRRARYDFLVKNHENRRRWFQWRADQVVSLRREILAAMRKNGNPQTTLLTALATSAGAAPYTELGIGLDGTRLGPEHGFHQAMASNNVTGIEMNWIDPYTMKNFDIREGVKPVDPKTMLENFGRFYPMGLCTGGGIPAPPYSTRAFAEFMAEKPLDRGMNGGGWALPPTNDQLRAWVRTFRAIPTLKFVKRPHDDNPAAVCWQSGNTAYWVGLRPRELTIRPDQPVTDLVTGETGSTFKLPPFGLALMRSAQPVKSFKVLEIPDITAVAVPRTGWDDPSAKHRLRLVLNNPGLADNPHAVGEIRGGELLKYRPQPASLRLFRNGRELPLQIDGRNADGFYTGDNRLDSHAAVVFSHSFKAGEAQAEFLLYLDGAPAAPRPSPFTVERAPQAGADRPWTLKLNSGPLEFGLLQSGIGLLRRDGKTAFEGVRRGGRLTPLLPFDWERARNAPPEPLKVFNAGPVRALVGFDLPPVAEFDWHFDGVPFYVREGMLRNARAQRVYELTAGADELLIRNLYRYDLSLLATFCTRASSSEAYRMDRTPMAGKVVSGVDKAGKVFTSEWKQLPQRSGFHLVNGYHHKYFAFWNRALDSGYTLAIPPADGWIGYRDSLFVTLNRKDPPKEGFEFQFRVALPPREDAAAARFWAQQAFRPASTVGLQRFETIQNNQ